MAEDTKKNENPVNTRRVTADEDGMRLDRWIKQHYPSISHGLLQKLLRKKAVRIDNKRAKTDTRLEEGQEVRVPDIAAPQKNQEKREFSKQSIAAIKEAIIYEDSRIIVLDKPHGMSTQGGTKVAESVDDILREIYTPAPKLIHRLDKDTSGVLLVAKTRATAEEAASAFQNRETKKVYWAIAIGVPKEREGKITTPLFRMKDKVIADEYGKKASTSYRVIDTLGKQLSLIELEPHTGRTHQLRVHLASIGHPILGDGKYGGKEAFPEFVDEKPKLCLHAKRLEIDVAGQQYAFNAPVSEHMQRVIKTFFRQCC